MKMNYLLIALAGSLSVASVAAAAVPMNDSDFIRASRCRGIAVGLGMDSAELTQRLKAEARIRPPMVLSQADDEFDRARRQARGDAKSRLENEYSSNCSAYVAVPTKAAAR